MKIEVKTTDEAGNVQQLFKDEIWPYVVSGSLPTPEQSKKAMLRKKTKFVDNMDKFSSRKNAYKQGWKDCYEWIMYQGNDH